ncbi:DddA-like double-stranded DNA deaminase toxin [Kribbella sp. NPDC051620]|uniref:DddA-like double-stranded DNA deaminase toxin n=1 Tax=Kribbella sp. NPDC051620 TaxID=3364120 RepID=UPI0037B39B1F
MTSELQRVAQQLLATFDEVPRVVGYLHDRAIKCRESAGWVGSMSNNPNARMAAAQLEEAARRCEEAAHYLSQAPLRARSWVEQMVSGVHTAEPGGGSAARRLAVSGGDTPLAERRKDRPAEPEAKKPRETAVPSDEEGWRLFGKLPNRVTSPVSRPKTRGIWKDADGKEHPLTSGRLGSDGQADDPYYQQVVDFMRQHRIGRQDADPMVASHVEAKFALFMRERGLMHETIVVNKIPCDGDFGCDTLLDRFLPQGGTLTVFGPAGFKRTYPKSK